MHDQNANYYSGTGVVELILNVELNVDLFAF